MNRMTPRERVRAAIEHRSPDRVPFSWGLKPTPEMQVELDRFLRAEGLHWPAWMEATEDSYHVRAPYTGPALAENTDIWGIRRRAVGYEAGSYDEIAVTPLRGVTSVAQIDKYPWPDPGLYADERLPELAREGTRNGRLALKLDIPCCGNLLETYTWMTGMEETMLNLAGNPEVVRAALDRIAGFFEERLRRCAEYLARDVDICYFADDLGGQERPLLSPRMYRSVIQPYHRRLFSLAHSLFPNMKVMFHTDGSVFDLIPDLLDAGVDILEAVQTDAAKMEPERLKAAYGDRLCFHGAISVQGLLPYATPPEVEAECRRLVAVLGQDGGYIAAPSHCIQVGTPPENVLAMLRGVLGEEEAQAALEKARAA